MDDRYRMMSRRELIKIGAGAVAVAAVPGCASRRTGSPGPNEPDGGPSATMTVAQFHSRRRFATTPHGRIAYVEQGAGAGALFLHGYPLNGYQWRGALARLSRYRRCIAPDFLGLGYTETAADQDLSPTVQADMLAGLLDALAVPAVDLVANDSGGAVAQLFVTRYPNRVRTLLLTNCDVHENSPPAALAPFLELARAGVAADQWLLPQLQDPEFARSEKGLGGGAYSDPRNLTDDSIRCYFAPLVSSPVRKAQFSRYGAAFEPNPLLAIEPALRSCTAPARIVWGTADRLFPVSWAEWLDRTLRYSRGVRRIEGAKLFFPEEMPDVIAAEAVALWTS